jgi:hypothetical protein
MKRRASVGSGYSGVVIGLTIIVQYPFSLPNRLFKFRKDCTSCQTESKQGRGLRRPRPPSRRRPAELLAILAHNRGGRPEPDADFAIAADKCALGGNAADNIFGGQRPPRRRILGHGFEAVPVARQPVKDVLAGRSLDH